MHICSPLGFADSAASRLTKVMPRKRIPMSFGAEFANRNVFNYS